MSYITDLRAELDSDAGRYAALSNQEVVDSINDKTVAQTKESISGSELWNATVPADYTALSDVQKSQWLALCGVASIDARNGSPAVAIATDLFSGGTTLPALIALRSFNISRAEELGFRVVKEGHVEMARAA